jgi:hypothetical protein
MDRCRSCGRALEDCNESVIVCPWCGEADCWPRLDEPTCFDPDDLDLDINPCFDADADEDTS